MEKRTGDCGIIFELSEKGEDGDIVIRMARSNQPAQSPGRLVRNASIHDDDVGQQIGNEINLEFRIVTEVTRKPALQRSIEGRRVFPGKQQDATRTSCS